MTSSNKPVRIFINQVDTYNGYYLAKYLSQCAIGASLDDAEEEEEEVGSVASGDLPIKPKEGCFEIHGTLRDKTSKKPEFVSEILQYESAEQMYEHLVECDYIVYDITEDADQIDEAMWAISEMHQDIKKIESQRVFILLSTVMTWAKSKMADEEDAEAALSEEDYRKRKPHQNYKEHIAAEKTVIKYGKTNKARLSTYVLASGLVYGCGENIFHTFFKSAWHNSGSLPVYGGGQNVLPTIHVKDLAACIQNIADSKPKTRYLVAVDDSQNSLEEIVKSISAGLSTGKIRTVTKEEAALSRDANQSTLDQLMVNLRLDAIYVKENFKINWACETGIVENIDQIIKEYKKERDLMPIKVCILGPPASGKTSLAKKLCEDYKLHHVKIKDVIDEAIAILQRSAARADAEEEDDDGKAAEDVETLEQVNENLAENNGRLDSNFVIKFFREKLSSKPCQNQGFVLDGFPKTKENAEELFAPDEDEEEGEEEESQYNKKLMPDNLYVLEASDDFLKQRVMQLPEAVVTGTHNTEDGLLRRLADYRAINTEDDSVVQHFDEKEIHPTYIDVAVHNEDAIFQKMKKEIGKARNYGLTAEEREEMARREEENRLAKERLDRDMRERREREEAEHRKLCQEEWAMRLEEVKREEHEMLEAQSLPLRNYLMKHVMPLLTQGLMDCAKTRPDDAIDYLAEYLFRNNPQID